MRRLSLGVKDQGKSYFELTSTNDDLQKALAVNDGSYDRCDQELKNDEGFDGFIDFPSVQFIGIEGDLKSQFT